MRLDLYKTHSPEKQEQLTSSSSANKRDVTTVEPKENYHSGRAESFRRNLKPQLLDETVPTRKTIDDTVVTTETEVIKLDKQYQQILKTEKEEYDRLLSKKTKDLHSNLEKKYKKQIEELRQTIEEKEDCSESLKRYK